MADSGITQVGKYHVLELVGEGAMGVVYRAVDPVLNRAVAVKVMNDALAREEELRARFLREAQAAGSLQHPNVITIYDFGEVEGHLYIAMEYVEGDDLEHVLNVREPLPLQTKLDIITDVLSGLAYAHKRGIVHRDIKPANIRLTEDRRAKIMDFGIAHLASSRATRTGMIVGTPDYMAPEQVTGGQITAATDLFSVGTVLYEILSGARPFQSTTVHGVLYKVVSEHPPALKSMNPGLPPELYAIVQRALAKDPASRFSSALEMAAAVSAVRSSLTDPPARQSSRSLHATLSGVSSSGPHGRQAPLPATRVVSAQPRRLAAG
ncbi:MAG TPA: serine/threonine-protein kinase, partial [Gemmatimonadaceae bacterium]|nr:serine/threonine-protein kinase [Gemmatimonadaceae bacterium]